MVQRAIHSVRLCSSVGTRRSGNENEPVKQKPTVSSNAIFIPAVEVGEALESFWEAFDSFGAFA